MSQQQQNQQENAEESLYAPKKRKSIFDTGYIKHPDDGLLQFKNHAYLRLCDMQKDAEATGNLSSLWSKNGAFKTSEPKTPNTSGGQNADKDSVASPFDRHGKFWEIAITRFEEVHEEKVVTHQRMDDGIILHCLGGMPIRITIEGYLPVGEDMDYRVRFLRKYMLAFKQRMLTRAQRTLEVHIRRTSFMLEIESLVLEESSDLSDYDVIVISGVAHHYNTDDGKPLEYAKRKSTSEGNSGEDALKAKRGTVSYKGIFGMG